MKATFLHVGIPVTDKREGMTYNERMKLWKNDNVDLYPFHIEYLKYEEGTPFPDVLHHNSHVAYSVDNMGEFINIADQVIWGPETLRPGFTMAFIEKDNVYYELLEIKA